MLVSALVPFVVQGACGLQDAEQHRPLECLGSQALFHISLCLLLLAIFELLTPPVIPMVELRHRASQGHTWSACCTCLSQSLCGTKLVCCDVQGQENKGRFRVVPSRAPILSSMCSPWKEGVAMPTWSRHNIPCLNYPRQHCKFVATHGVRARSLKSFAFLLLTLTAPAAFSFTYRCGYLRIRLHIPTSGLKLCLVIYAGYEYTAYGE